MATLLSIPPEVQLMIADRVEEKDLLALNLSCRAMHSLVEPVIASIFGSIRTFDLSREGMDDLLTLSEDDVRAPYLKTLIIVHDRTTTPISHLRRLAQALKNFSAVSKNLVTLGVRRSAQQDTSPPPGARPYLHVKHFVRQLLAAAKRAGLRVNNVTYELEVPANIFDWSIERRAWTQPSLAQDDFVVEAAQMFAVMNTLDTMSFPKVGRGFRLVETGKESTRHSPSGSYDPIKQSLSASHLHNDDWKLVLRWLPPSIQLKVVNLCDCNVEFRAFDELIINPSLESLTVEDVTLVWNRHMNGHWLFGNLPSTMNVLLQDWRVVFDKLLAGSPDLSSCRLGQLTFHYRTLTGATWEVQGTENVKELLRDLKWKKCSRMAYKKRNAPHSEPRKPRKKVPKTRKFRLSHKKISKKKK